MRRVKAGPLEAEFEREVRELRTSADATTSSQPPTKPSWQEEVERLAQANLRIPVTLTECAGIRWPLLTALNSSAVIHIQCLERRRPARG